MCYWLTVHGFLPRGVLSELDSGERSEAVLRALFPYQCGFGFAWALGPRSHSCARPMSFRSERVPDFFFLPAFRLGQVTKMH